MVANNPASELQRAPAQGRSAPAISVVVPCRNERLHIAETVQSILEQQGVEGGYEVLVVDGESDDGTREVLSQIQSSHPELRVVDNPDRITAAAMNRGIELSSGDLVAILGAHTLYPADYLATCQHLLTEHPDAGCVGGTIESRGESHFGKAVAFAMSHPAGVGNARHRYPRYEGYAEGACFPVFRREALLRTGLYDTELVRNQDDDLNFRFRQLGERVFISYRARCVYFVRESAGALFRQYFQYGAWRLRVLRKHGEVAAWRQLVPVVFWAWLLLAAVLTPWVPASWQVWLWAPGLAYAVVLLWAMFSSLSSLGVSSALRVPPALGTMHAAYGLGFASAFFRRPAR
jgi:glycosyltransferase involved in cell wall biosynthesis